MSAVKSVEMPDIGDAGAVEVIETMMQAGDQVLAGQAILTVEGDKASMDIPCEVSGIVRKILVAVGDDVQQGDLIAHIEVNDVQETQNSNANQSGNTPDTIRRSETTQVSEQALNEITPALPASRIAQAGPSSRRLARKLGVEILEVVGTGRRGRILKEDVQAHVKALFSKQSAGVSSAELSVLPDISRFGSTHSEKLSKVEQVTSRNMQRAWREIPHAWLQQSIDITELDQGRKRLKADVEGLTITAIIVKAISLTLAQFPRFNCILDAQAQQLIYRDYINIGIAVDTPRGLVIAVIRDVDRLSISATGIELDRLSALARAGELPVIDMQGSSMTVSSLGGLGVEGLQPIVNWPEVAIIGIAKAGMQAVYTNSQFEPRLMLPVTLGFDHRVINGADGARFLAHFKQLLSDPMRLLVMS